MDFKMFRAYITLIVVICMYDVAAHIHIEAIGGKESTLELIHVVFRHGDRTPDASTIYPNDPYRNETYFPYGLGALTNNGKRREYNIGKALRFRYDKFIGDIYSPNIIDVQTSPIRRTKISAQLVLASLFPPSAVEKWNPFLNWQPVDFEYTPEDEDLLFLHFSNCPRYIQAREQHFKEIINSGEITSFEQLSLYLTINTGWNVTSLFQYLLIYNCLKTEEEWGFSLPEWTNLVYPEPLSEITKSFWLHSADTDELKRLSGGFILRRIAESTQMKLNGNTEALKLYLYSGHDFTISALLNVLGVFEPHHPPYGAYIIFEIHRIFDNYGIKVFYQDYTSKHPKLITLPGCDEVCPFDVFLLLYSKYFPTPDMCNSA